MKKAFVASRLLSGDLVLEGTPEVYVLVNPTTGEIESFGHFEGFFPPEVEVVRLGPAGDTTIMPGFIDCHVHLTIAKDDYQADHLRLSSAAKALRALRAAQSLLEGGFTTVRSAGEADTHFPHFAVREAIDRGEFTGPRIVGAGHYISVTGGGGDINWLSSEVCGCGADGLVCDGEGEMTEAVRREIKYGSDWIKILASGAFMAAGQSKKDSPENTHVSGRELRACVEEAARRKVPVMAHAHGAEAIRLAIASGCRSIEHSSFIDAEGIAMCLARSKDDPCFLVPTFTIGEWYQEHGSATGAQDRMIALQKATDARFHSCIRAAAAAGCRICLGSDFVGWSPGSVSAREFRFLVELAGMSPIEAIKAGTCNAAEMLDLPVGRIEKGLMADLVVVRGNPLEDISLLETGLVAVIKDGKQVKVK